MALANFSLVYLKYLAIFYLRFQFLDLGCGYVDMSLNSPITKSLSKKFFFSYQLLYFSRGVWCFSAAVSTLALKIFTFLGAYLSAKLSSIIVPR